jgi:DNA primase
MITRSELTRQAIHLLNLRTQHAITEHTDNIFVHCPFHVDKTPSLSISLERGIYRCFSCQSGGSIEKLYREVTGDNLYKVLGIKDDPFDMYAFQRTMQAPLQETFENYFEKTHIRYEPADFKSIKYNPLALRYLRRRAIPLSVAHELGMRYVEKGYINNTLFEKRLTIPIYENGKLVSIEGRDITGLSTKDKTYPKCKYPKGSSVNTLFDIDNLNKEEDIYAVEGIMDVAILRKYPQLQNSTALFGSGITRRQIHLIKQCRRFILIPDNDAAGEGAIRLLREQQLDNVWILRLPSTVGGVYIKDPGDYDTKTKENLGDLLKKKWLSYARPLN